MTVLVQEHCEACQSGAPTLSAKELADVRDQIPDWEVIQRDGMQQLQRIYKVRNFAEALVLTNRIGELAEAEGHHPAVLTEWGRVTVRWWTHKIGGLHRNDVIMAAKTDQIA